MKYRNIGLLKYRNKFCEKNPPASMHENSRSDLLYRRNTAEKNRIFKRIRAR